MTTTTVVVVILIALVVAAVVIGLVVRSRRRGAQAAERMGLPPLGAVSGDPVDPSASEVPATPRPNPQTRP